MSRGFKDILVTLHVLVLRGCCATKHGNRLSGLRRSLVLY